MWEEGDAEDFVRSRMDATSAERVRSLLEDHRGQPAPPLDAACAALADARDRGADDLAWMAAAAVVEEDELADPDAETLVALLAATISPLAQPRVPEGVADLDHVTWLSIIVGLLVRRAGAAADPASLSDLVDTVAPHRVAAKERAARQQALDAIVPAWQAVGVLDGEQRLTDTGVWLLPRAACYAWDSDFDDPVSVDGPGHWELPFDDEPGDLDAAEQAIADAAVEQLAAAGPLGSGDLARAVGRDLGEPVSPAELDPVLLAVRDVMQLRDGRWVHLHALLDGMVLTHRLTEVECELGALLLDPDLFAYVWVPGDVDLAGGGTVGVRYRRGHPMDVHDALVGPDGWLGSFEPGELVAVRRHGGALAVEAVAEADLDLELAARTVERLAETDDLLGGANELGGPIDVPELLLETLARAPLTLARPQPPLGELLDQAGLDLYDGGGLYDAGDEDAADEADLLLAEIYDLGPSGVDAHHLLRDEVERVALDGIEALDEAALDDVAAALADAAVAESLADVVQSQDATMTAALRDLASAAARRGRGRGRAGPAFLCARTAELAGRAEEAEAWLAEALEADPACRPALLDAAWYAEDRGDALRAQSLLRRASVDPGDPQLERLAGWADPSPAPGVGRNDPCPCGSGRKYKKCCQGGGQPLATRAGWLLDKAGTFAHRPTQRPRLLPLVEARAGDTGDPDRILDAMRDALVQDLALFEEGLLERFLDERGVLLPADERMLGRSWVGIRRGLFEVVDVRPGEGLTLLDLRSGLRLDVVERTGSHTIRAGETVLARPLPVGDHHVLAAGNVRVPVGQREALLGLLDLDPGGPELAGWVTALEAPPRLVTMEGEETVFCEAVYEVADAAAAAGALDARYRARGDHWTEPVATDTGTWTRGTLRLDGNRLVVNTNSVPRLERFTRVLADILPDARLVDEERRTLDDVRRSGEPPPAPGPPPELDDEVAAALEQMVREQEARWVDESVPALGGLTPRQAADDPTWREHLRALLDEFDEIELPSGGQGMDAGRLRARLGL